MSAEPSSEPLVDFDPRTLVQRARRRQSRSARFESFADIYVWVLAAVVALTYLVSALYGAIFVVLGEGLPHARLPSAIWPLEQAALFLLPLLGLLVLRILLYLGPCALSRERAAWWLPLPISLRRLHLRIWGTALATGAALGTGAMLLWGILFGALAGSLPWASLLWSVASGLSGGVALAAAAVCSQIAGRHRVTLRVTHLLMVLLLGLFGLVWAAQAAGYQPLNRLMRRLGDVVMGPGLWAALCLAAVLLATALGVHSLRRLGRLSAQTLQLAGERQQLVTGALSHADIRGLGRNPQPGMRRGRIRAAWLPVTARVLTLRLIRGHRMRGPVTILVVGLLLMLAVVRAANPLTFSVLLGVLLVAVSTGLAEVFRPLLTQPALAQMLGVSTGTVARSCLGLGLCLTLGLSALWAVALWAVGLAGGIPVGVCLVAIALAGLGVAAAATAHAQRPERDWEAIFGAATNELSVAALLGAELLTVLHALAAGAPLYVLALAPQASVPWGIWAVGALCAAPALARFRG